MSSDLLNATSLRASAMVKSSTEYKKLEKRLRHQVGSAVMDYSMIDEGDVVMACVSGGKDSFAMLDCLLHLSRVAPVSFRVVAVNLDQKQPGFPEHILPEYLSNNNIDYYVIDKDTYSVVRQKIPEGKTTCGLCSRLRRGTLYAFAEQMGATKIALGHHMDDIVETLFLNMFHGGKLKAMPPKLLADDKRNVIIRPMSYCREADIAQYAAIKQYPIIPCNLCGSQENLQRQTIKAMLNNWDKEQPGRVQNIFKSTQNVSASQLADRALFDFNSLSIDRKTQKAPYDFEDAMITSEFEKSHLHSDVVKFVKA